MTVKSLIFNPTSNRITRGIWIWDSFSSLKDDEIVGLHSLSSRDHKGICVGLPHDHPKGQLGDGLRLYPRIAHIQHASSLFAPRVFKDWVARSFKVPTFIYSVPLCCDLKKGKTLVFDLEPPRFAFKLDAYMFANCCIWNTADINLLSRSGVQKFLGTHPGWPSFCSEGQKTILCHIWTVPFSNRENP